MECIVFDIRLINFHYKIEKIRHHHQEGGGSDNQEQHHLCHKFDKFQLATLVCDILEKSVPADIEKYEMLKNMIQYQFDSA